MSHISKSDYDNKNQNKQSEHTSTDKQYKTLKQFLDDMFTD